MKMILGALLGLIVGGVLDYLFTSEAHIVVVVCLLLGITAGTIATNDTTEQAGDHNQENH